MEGDIIWSTFWNVAMCTLCSSIVSAYMKKFSSCPKLEPKSFIRVL